MEPFSVRFLHNKDSSDITVGQKHLQVLKSPDRKMHKNASSHDFGHISQSSSIKYQYQIVTELPAMFTKNTIFLFAIKYKVIVLLANEKG